MTDPLPAFPYLVGVIDIGSSAIRVLIAEITAPGEWRTIDSAQQPVGLGRDVFGSGKIGRDTIVQALQILGAYKEMLDAYQVGIVRAIATSALREAQNSDTFIDRVRVRTKIQIEIIEGIEANQLTYLAVRHALRGARPQLQRSNSMIMEVGGGSTEIMLLERGRILSAHTLAIGTVRMMPVLRRGGADQDFLERYLRENSRSTLEMLHADAPVARARVNHFIAVGGDARLAAQHVGHESRPNCASIALPDFRHFVRKLQGLSLHEVVDHLQIHYTDAETLVPALLLYLIFAESTAAAAILVPNVSIRDGTIWELSTDARNPLHEEFRRQVLASARNVGMKYHYDELHADQVADLSLQLFDFMQEEHALGPHQRLLLQVASLLHDIGSFVNTSAHHKHGQYLVANSDIFGLNRTDINIISNVVRYHRKAQPLPTHVGYVSLAAADRVVVLKLAAILRVADALDRGHRRRIRQVAMARVEDSVVLRCSDAGDLALEQYSLEDKGNLFEEVYGLKIELR